MVFTIAGMLVDMKLRFSLTVAGSDSEFEAFTIIVKTHDSTEERPCRVQKTVTTETTTPTEMTTMQTMWNVPSFSQQGLT